MFTFIFREDIKFAVIMKQNIVKIRQESAEIMLRHMHQRDTMRENEGFLRVQKSPSRFQS